MGKFTDIALLLAAACVVGIMLADRLSGWRRGPDQDLRRPPADWMRELGTGISMGNLPAV